MPTKRGYLIERGILSPDRGRGRWPAAAHEAIKAAINEGIKFDEPDTGPKRTVRIEVKENGKTVVKTARVNDVAVAAEPRHDRHEGLYVFQNPNGKQFKRLHTNVCVRCQYSFQWCYCPDGPAQFVYHDWSVPSGTLAVFVSAPADKGKVARGRPRKAA